jgi:hypothetical protein
MTTLEQRLQERIESAIQEYLQESRAKVTATLERAFGGATRTPMIQRTKSPSRASSAVAHGKRRTASELEALSEQLYEAIAASPGEGMVALSERLGVPGRQLQRVVARLRADGRIRTVGTRQLMRYFPRA